MGHASDFENEIRIETVTGIFRENANRIREPDYTAMSSKTSTQPIQVKVRSQYIPQRSKPNSEVYFFAYTITITNTGEAAAKLISRHWYITDAYDQAEEIQGDGVVGEQPHLLPGESFEYTSFCPLKTQYGTMRGFYHFIYDDGASFEVPIPEFPLLIPALAN